MNVGDLVEWKSDHGTADDIGIVLSFHPMDGDPFIWWAGDNQYSYCSLINLGDTLILIGGKDGNR